MGAAYASFARQGRCVGASLFPFPWVVLAAFVACFATSGPNLAIFGSDLAAADRLPTVPGDAIRFRGPVGLALTADGCTALTANRRGDSLSIVDLKTGIVSEWRLPGSPRDVAMLADARCVLVNEEGAELLVVSLAGNPVITERIPVAKGPVSVAVSPDGSRLAVCGLWSRTVSLLERRDEGWSRRDLELNWSPRFGRHSPDGELLVVADAFGGGLCVIDRAGVVVSTAMLDAHNFGGIAFTTPCEFLLTHQMLHAEAPTTSDNIAAGLVVENVIRTVRLDPSPDGGAELRSVALREIGVPSNGAADPAELIVLPDGKR